jgi:hypothetical protein
VKAEGQEKRITSGNCSKLASFHSQILSDLSDCYKSGFEGTQDVLGFLPVFVASTVSLFDNDTY